MASWGDDRWGESGEQPQWGDRGFPLHMRPERDPEEQWDAENRTPQENDQCDQFVEALVDEGFADTKAQAFSDLVDMGYDPYDMGELLELVD